MFTSPLPLLLHSFDWRYVIHLLLNARHDSSSLLSRQILHDMISQHIPTWIRTHKSASLLYGIGDGVRYWAADYPEHAIKLFTDLDKIMVEFCSELEGAEGLNKDSIESWRIVRASFATDHDERRNGYWYWRIPEQYRLHIRHFDDLPGHGPLSLPSPLLPPPPSSDRADIETDIH